MTATARKGDGKVRAIGAHSRLHSLRKLDGRTKEARYLRQIEDDLIRHLGGPDRVSVAQAFLIRRVAIDILRLELLDGEMARGSISDHDARVAHALRNSVRLALRDIGWQAVEPAVPTIGEYLARRAAEREAAEAEAAK